MFAIRILLQNGLAFYLTWLSVVAILNFNIFIRFMLAVEGTKASTIALSILLALMVVYFLVENFLWQRFLLYVISPWIVLLLTFDAMLTYNWYAGFLNQNNYLTLAMFALTAVFLAAKLIMICLYKSLCSHRYDTYKEPLTDLN
jgi:hypothetical protein